eukprot:SM000082S22891  [mRNA]  locus=s82:552311:553457:- [translate_table: standard]
MAATASGAPRAQRRRAAAFRAAVLGRVFGAAASTGSDPQAASGHRGPACPVQDEPPVRRDDAPGIQWGADGAPCPAALGRDDERSQEASAPDDVREDAAGAPSSPSALTRAQRKGMKKRKQREAQALVEDLARRYTVPHAGGERVVGPTLPLADCSPLTESRRHPQSTGSGGEASQPAADAEQPASGGSAAKVRRRRQARRSGEVGHSPSSSLRSGAPFTFDPQLKVFELVTRTAVL